VIIGKPSALALLYSAQNSKVRARWPCSRWPSRMHQSPINYSNLISRKVVTGLLMSSRRRVREKYEWYASLCAHEHPQVNKSISRAAASRPQLPVLVRPRSSRRPAGPARALSLQRKYSDTHLPPQRHSQLPSITLALIITAGGFVTPQIDA
jgi:hypothetical protein